MIEIVHQASVFQIILLRREIERDYTLLVWLDRLQENNLSVIFLVWNKLILLGRD